VPLWRGLATRLYHTCFTPSCNPFLQTAFPRTVDLWVKAEAQGRTLWDYDAGIPLGRFYEAHPALYFFEARVLRLKPTTVGLLLTDLLMRRPRSGGGDAAPRAASAWRSLAAAASGRGRAEL
jgi:hypothetical protein